MVDGNNPSIYPTILACSPSVRLIYTGGRQAGHQQQLLHDKDPQLCCSWSSPVFICRHRRWSGFRLLLLLLLLLLVVPAVWMATPGHQRQDRITPGRRGTVCFKHGRTPYLELHKTTPSRTSATTTTTTTTRK